VIVANRKPAVDALMFDLDGTIIDSVPIYYQIIALAFASLGLPPVPNPTLVEAIKDGDFNWDLVLPPSARHVKEQRIHQVRALIEEIGVPMLRDQVELVAGTAETLANLANSGIKLGLVTSTPASSMALKSGPLVRAGIDRLFEVVITADDVRRKKPDAEPLMLGSQKLGVPANRCAYVGDMRMDIKAGKAAGMKTIGVLTGFDHYAALLEEKPDAIVESIARLEEATSTLT